MACGGEGPLEDESHCRNLCLSGCKGRGVWGLAQVGLDLGGAAAHLQVRTPRPGTHSGGDLGQPGKAPRLGLGLVDK